MEEIACIRSDLVSQSSTATAVVNLTGQLARTEQRLEAKMTLLELNYLRLFPSLPRLMIKMGKKRLEEEKMLEEGLKAVQLQSQEGVLLRMKNVRKGSGDRPLKIIENNSLRDAVVLFPGGLGENFISFVGVIGLFSFSF